MSTFTAIRFPHFLTTKSFQMHSRPYQYQGFGGIPHAVDHSTLAIIPAQERMALPLLNVLPSRVNASSGYSQKVAASPVATFSPQPAQSPSKKRVRALPNASNSITLDMLRPHFEKPLAEVANIFGICMTLMKKNCRKNGVPRWPHRQIRGSPQEHLLQISTKSPFKLPSIASLLIKKDEPRANFNYKF
ncbi:unnamed protein product [Peronospora destructor]|uniref:RWP-RK domain-containing protein n=1 Tax=Peronospora destructor TaxID=86335 RepID=A0AAV0TXN3_9STRA|nr:unnamed protein product [Peronospora destructor]